MKIPIEEWGKLRRLSNVDPMIKIYEDKIVKVESYHRTEGMVKVNVLGISLI